MSGLGSTKAHVKGTGTPVAASQPTHLIVLVNGLFGCPANWITIQKQLALHLDRSQVCWKSACTEDNYGNKGCREQAV